MFIQEIIIDGFKSYAKRTVVSGFDSHFNAITGLNGSGKSNILDSICFVLGISNLSQVRASNLQDLVYKSGQAGITKASVTIVFDNSDPSQSPVGYEQFKQITVTRQVVVGGRNKYLINGHTAHANQVQNLFHSVQLNVNNPHFLIMQGRITKVINMKPAEILSMIEEAAGTRMFEMKKQAAQRTIAKKQTKVEEINKVLSEEITPTLDKLRNERTHYMRWASNNTEIERLSRFCIAHNYTCAVEMVNKSAGTLQKMEIEFEELNAAQEELTRIMSELDQKTKELVQQREEQISDSVRLLQEEQDELSKQLVQHNSVWENSKQSLATEQESLNALERSEHELLNDINQLNDELQTKKEVWQTKKQFSDQMSSKVASLQRQLQAVSAGMTADEDDGSTVSLNDKLLAAQRRQNEASTATEQAKLKIKHAKANLKALSKQVCSAEKALGGMKDELNDAERSVSSMEAQLVEMNFDPTQEEALIVQKEAKSHSVVELRERVDTFAAELSYLDFNYSDPVRGFDRSKVHGVVAQLIRIPDVTFSTALEVAAGGKLYQVIVDNEETGKLLLERGRLRRRVTIIPLNKISRRTLDSNVVSRAQSLARGRGRVDLALSLVGYDEQVSAAMEYVFGTTLVCDTLELAKTVTFDKKIRTRTVTLDGDLFDPAGTLTGGSQASSSNILEKLQQFNSLCQDLEQQEAELASIEGRLSKLRKRSAQHATLTQEIELKRHEAELIRERIGQTLHGKLIAEQKELENTIEICQMELSSAEDTESEEAQNIADLQEQIARFQNSRDREMKSIEKQISETKQDAQESAKQAKVLEQEFNKCKHEIEQVNQQLIEVQDQIKSTRESVEILSVRVSELEQSVVSTRSQYTIARNAYQSKRQQMTECDQEITSLRERQDKASKQHSEKQISIKRLEHRIIRFHKEQEDAGKVVDKLEKEHPWIASEKRFFGKPNTDYDFEARDCSQAKNHLEELKQQQSSLAKKINKKVMGMIEKAEQEYEDLVKKKRIIENDRSKIEAVINELEAKKNEALHRTWLQVNQDFSSIFSTLLPGTQAKLEPPENMNVLDGLEMRVAFGDCWKESLSELSGGQRSLLALSLILALLLFKPAPMYILDEIDAALDLSHTQNIGHMLKTHFSHSQFIVVSLKEGMFNNANVLFRTKFVDGVSTITRTVPQCPTSSTISTRMESASFVKSRKQDIQSKSIGKEKEKEKEIEEKEDYESDQENRPIQNATRTIDVLTPAGPKLKRVRRGRKNPNVESPLTHL